MKRYIVADMKKNVDEIRKQRYRDEMVSDTDKGVK